MNQYVKPLFDKCKDYLDPEFTEENFDKICITQFTKR